MEFQYNFQALKVCGFFIPTELKASTFRKLWFCFILLPFVMVHVLMITYNVLEGVPVSVYDKVIFLFNTSNGLITVFRHLHYSLRKTQFSALLASFSGYLLDMEFEYNLSALKVSGFYIPTELKVTRWRRFWFHCTLLPFMLVHLLMLLYLKNEGFPDSVYPRVILLFHSSNGLITVFRRLYYSFSKKQFSNLLRLFSEPSTLEPESFAQLERRMRVTSTQKIRRNSRLSFAYISCTILLIVALFLVLRIVGTYLHSSPNQVAQKNAAAPPRLLLFKIWWFTEPRDTPTYYFIVIWQCVTVATHLAIANTTDALACSLMLATAARCEFLARAAPQALLPGPGGQITPHFKAWVLYHQHYLSIVEKMNEFIGAPILITYFSSISGVISFSYMCIMIDDVAMKVLTGIVIAGLLFQIYIISNAGQQIIDKSEQLASSVLGIRQVARAGLKAGPARNALQVLVTRLSGGARPEFVSGMGFFPVSLDLYSSVLSACVSYLLFLLHFKRSGPAILSNEHA